MNTVQASASGIPTMIQTGAGGAQAGASGSSGARGKNYGQVIQQLQTQNFRYRDNEKFAGAIKKEKHVLSIDRNMEWALAQILEVRYEVPYDEDALFWDPEDSTNDAAAAKDADGETQMKVDEEAAGDDGN